MASHTPIALVIHGHFYQPPRENPWTDEVSREPSALPYHDWNERILSECYRANAFARVYGAGGRLQTLVNNYSHLSFNVGPTLARWIDKVDPTTSQRLRAGDEDQRKALGAGGALAQVWGHPIAPLCSPRDRRTQIRWGLDDFEHRFGRKADGIWLPETAADPATLESLIEAGLSYTILAPEQIGAVRPPGGAWKTVTRDTVDTGRAYRFVHGDGSGRSLALAVFDGPLSRELAFGTATRDSESLLAAVSASAARSSVATRRLVLAASDGELYGHHKKFADLTLAHVNAVAATARGLEVTNLGAFLRAEPPVWEAELAKGPGGEGTAWSCHHGLGRWQRDCGCSMRPREESGWNQAWRTPLRSALDHLRDRAADLYTEMGGELLADPWAARDEFGAVLEAPPEQRQHFLARRGRSRLRGSLRGTQRRVALLLEMQRACLLMYASCGWFFDDVAGVESALVIRQAAYALDLWKDLGGKPPTEAVLDVLAQAHSNMPGAGTGADVFQRMSQHRTTSVHAVAATAMSELAGVAGAGREHTSVPGFTIHRPKLASRKPVRLTGRAEVTRLRTGETETLPYEATAHGLLTLDCRVGRSHVALGALPEDSREPIVLALLARLAVASRVTARDCARALELARMSGGAGRVVAPALRPAFPDLLRRLVAHGGADQADAETIEVVAALLDAVPEGIHDEAKRRTEEWIWQGITAARGRGMAPSSALEALAERLGFERPHHPLRARR
jgi:alpha-amylase/alpha-mannosidase (GH57 family)